MSAPIEQQFQDVLAGHALRPGKILADGGLHRFTSPGDGKNEQAGWYVLHANGLAAGAFGDWRTGLSETWCAKPERDLTKAERQELRHRVEQAKAASAKARGIAQQEARAQCATIWAKAEPARRDHPYVIKKGIQASGARQLHDKLVVPLCDVSGVLRSVQFIAPDGGKQFKAAGRVKGCFCLLGEVQSGIPLLICEGWATASSLHEATGYPVAAAMNAGNLAAVAQALRDKHADVEIILAADDDVQTAGNPGLTKAKEAAAVVGAHLAVPNFGPDRAPGFTDFNDLHVQAGLDAVRTSIESAKLLNADTTPPEDDATKAAASNDADTIARLSRLSALDYDRARKLEAKHLGVQVSTLDRLTREARAQNAVQDDAPFAQVEPRPEPVDGASLLSDMAQAVKRFIVIDNDSAAAVTLWCACTWLVDVIDTCPLLLITAPEKGCGKSQLLSVVGKLVPRPAPMASISPSVLFRMVEKYRPSLLIDEIDTVLGAKDTEELRGLLNAGHTRDSAFAWRSVAVGDDFEPKRFNVFGFKALAGIHAERLAETITSRSIVVHMRKRCIGEPVQRLRHAPPELFEALRSRLARWADDHAADIGAARPDLPHELDDRSQDNYESLLAVADEAGGRWPAYARAVAVRLCGTETATSVGSELLADIREVFNELRADRIGSADLLTALCRDEEHHWASWNRGKPMTQRQLARLLAGYGIKSTNLKVACEVRKGYRLESFKDAFSRYLNLPPDSASDPLQRKPGAGSGVADEVAVAVCYPLHATSPTAGANVQDVVHDEHVVAGSGSPNATATGKPALDMAGSGCTDKSGGEWEINIGDDDFVQGELP